MCSETASNKLGGSSESPFSLSVHAALKMVGIDEIWNGLDSCGRGCTSGRSGLRFLPWAALCYTVLAFCYSCVGLCAGHQPYQCDSA